MNTAINSGIPYETILSPPPADPSMADSQIEVSVVAQLDSITATGPVTPVLTGFSIPIGFDPAYVRLVSAVSGTASGYTSGGFESTDPAVANARGFVTIMNLRAGSQNPGLQVELARLTFNLVKPGKTKFRVGTSRTVYQGVLAAVPSDTGSPTEPLSWIDSESALNIEPDGAIPSLLSPSWISEEGMFQGMVYMNDGTDDASLQLFGWDSDGLLHQPGSSENPSPVIPLPALNQYAKLDYEIFNSPAPMDIEDGWIKTQLNATNVSGFFSQGYTPAGLILQLDSAPMIDAPASRLIFPLVAPDPGRPAEIQINNPGDSPVDITTQLIDSEGAIQSIETEEIPAHGTFLQEIIEMDIYANVEATNGQLIGVERFGTPDALAMLNGHDVTQASNRLCAPQFASGYLSGTMRITTHISLVNPTEEASNVTLRLVNENGEPIVDPVVQTIEAGEMLSMPGWELFGLEDPTTTSQVVVGTVAVESDNGLIGALMFGDPVGGSFLASLPLMSTASAKREIVFGHTAVGQLGSIDYFTGLALVNTSQTATAHIYLEYHNSSGELVAETATPFTLGPNSRTAQLVQQLIPDFPVPQSGGFIRLTSDIEVYGYMLYGDSFYNFISAVP